VLLSADGVGTQGIMDATIARQGIHRMPELGASPRRLSGGGRRVTPKQGLLVFCPTRPARLARSRRHRAALMK
jgi:hypothetical protein